MPDHLHVHVLPRWDGDTNFMTAVAETRVLPEPLDAELAEAPRRLALTAPSGRPGICVHGDSGHFGAQIGRGVPSADDGPTARRDPPTQRAPTTSATHATRTGRCPDEDVRDALPEDLDASGYVGPYLFPNNNRRRVPGVLYLVPRRRVPRPLAHPPRTVRRSS